MSMDDAFNDAIAEGDHHLAKFKEWPVCSQDVVAVKDDPSRRRYGRSNTQREKIQLPKRDDHLFGDLWDESDPRFLDKVQCKALIRVMSIDPKLSTFEIRMTCHWKFRTLHGEERTETRLRTPGIRMPGLIVTVDESRIWRDMEKAKESIHSVFWRGISVFTILGFERFEMYDFPFDRQILRMDLVEFVWRSDKDSRDHDFSMQLCALQVETESMLPEWEPAAAFVHAENVTPKEQKMTPNDFDRSPPRHASRFTVLLRVERKNWYYVIQVFGLTILITIFSSFPLFMPCTSDYLGDRLSTYTGGLLTLTAFKYGIADKLPSVPYSTKFDWIMFSQMVFLIVVAFEALIAYRVITEDGADSAVHSSFVMSSKSMDAVECIVALLTTAGWLFYWFYLAADQLKLSWFPFGIRPKTWKQTLESQDQQEVYQDKYADDESDVPSEVEELQQELEKTNKAIQKNLHDEYTPGKTQEEISRLQNSAKTMRARRDKLEMQLQKKAATAQE
mmetsp:Transcript_64494/g.181439  ORF Transcript_64494/g.181439 Transcript_64494/m.181439 type:complete len:504 (+) Transcript_64494:50-1561(+)